MAQATGVPEGFLGWVEQVASGQATQVHPVAAGLAFMAWVRRERQARQVDWRLARGGVDPLSGAAPHACGPPGTWLYPPTKGGTRQDAQVTRTRPTTPFDHDNM